MPRRLSQEAFLERCYKAHKETYLYSKAVYNGSANKVIITCRVHGDFEQEANSHMQGKGCPKCDKSKPLTREEVLERSKCHHGNKYDYSRVTFVSTKTKIEIGCTVHGWFFQTPEEHMNGAGCSKCADIRNGLSRRIPLGDFINDCVKNHDIQYDYSLVKDLTTASVITIICPVHGLFEQQANVHRYGGDCPHCQQLGGYKTTKAGWLYIFKCGNITKVGITNKGVSYRCKEVSKSSGLKFKVLTAIKFENGMVPRRIETYLLRELRANYSSVPMNFNGSTECFLDVDYEYLLMMLAKIGIDVYSNI